MGTQLRLDMVQRDVVEGALREAAWDAYVAAFDELRVIAIQQHLHTREEFDQIMGDRAVTKYLGRHLDSAGDLVDVDGTRLRRVCAIGTFTNDLRSIPLVSPDFFAARWPEYYRTGRCFYIGFIGVHPEYHGTGMFVDIVTGMSQVVIHQRGVAVLDVCAHNNAVYRMPQTVLRIGRSIDPTVVGEPVDTQTYWALEAPQVIDLTQAEPREHAGHRDSVGGLTG